MNNFNIHFLNRMKAILGGEYDDFLTSLSLPDEKAIYVNQHKISVDSFKNIVDFKLEQIPYESAGFYVDSNKKGRHVLHHAGAFYMQEPSAMFTVNAHQFKGDELVLDMCAAPGGKSIQIANRIPNGTLVSNEFNSSRSQILFSNIERMGLSNVIITNESSENLAKAYANTFDVCLVDAPCSGEGMFRRGDDVIKEWNVNLPAMCANRQLDILKNADKVLKQYGILIYSTCTYSLEENEEVVQRFMTEYNYELVNINYPLPRGINMSEAVRLYPHKVRGEGQFVAVLKKLSVNEDFSSKHIRLQQDKTAQNWLAEHTSINKNVMEWDKFSYIVPNESLIMRNIKYVSLGVRAFERVGKRVEPCHNLFSAFGKDFKNRICLNWQDDIVLNYLKGETFEVDNINGYASLIVNSCSVGGVKVSNGIAKNHYPKGLRNFK